MKRIGCALAASWCLVASTASGQTAADVDRAVDTGQYVFVVDSLGREIEGRVQSVSPNHLTLLTRGLQYGVPIDDIISIDRRRYDDLRNGGRAGLIAGTSGAMAMMVAAHRSCSQTPTPCDRFNVFSYGMAGLAGAALGTAVGGAVDALIVGRRSVYRRDPHAAVTIAPAIGRGVRGAVVSLRW